MTAQTSDMLRKVRRAALPRIPSEERGAAEGEVVEGDVEEILLRGRPPERLGRALGDGSTRGEQSLLVRSCFNPARFPLCLGQEQVAIVEALKRIQERVLGLPLGCICSAARKSASASALWPA